MRSQSFQIPRGISATCAIKHQTTASVEYAHGCLPKSNKTSNKQKQFQSYMERDRPSMVFFWSFGNQPGSSVARHLQTLIVVRQANISVRFFVQEYRFRWKFVFIRQFMSFWIAKKAFGIPVFDTYFDNLPWLPKLLRQHFPQSKKPHSRYLRVQCNIFVVTFNNAKNSKKDVVPTYIWWPPM